MKDHLILLASKSPRRRELLAGLGIPFRVVDVNADENYPSELREGDIPLFIARSKAAAYAEPLAEGEVLLTADTIVWLDGEVLGKPKDEGDAVRMLHRLSGKTHQVYTAVCLRFRCGAPMNNVKWGESGVSANNVPPTCRDSIILPSLSDNSTIGERAFVSRSDVTFRTLSDEEIYHYVRHYRPLDKAGAYGIQEWIGYIGCVKMEGSFYNVMGLPTAALYDELKKIL
ncbi:MAG: Maf family protein [Paludibacteraceae bacterium]|nr:Maf family protein [Paludibacteraceae bacterium]